MKIVRNFNKTVKSKDVCPGAIFSLVEKTKEIDYYIMTDDCLIVNLETGFVYAIGEDNYFKEDDLAVLETRARIIIDVDKEEE